MSWDDLKERPASTDVKKAIYKSSSGSHFYSIFRIGTKYKTMDGKQNSGVNMIKNFQKHMEREINVTNANANIQNEILIGDKNIYENVKEYLKDVKVRKNSVYARELLQTASPDFFKGLSNKDLQKWKDENIKFLKDNFGTNCIYSTLHKDEKTWHIHSLIVPRFENKKGELILSNSRYFDGIEKMREWQNNYAKSMQEEFKCLNRGIKYSKAKHLTIRQYYTLVNESLNEKNIAQVLAKAQNNELLEIKIKAITKTLQVYKSYSSKSDIEKENAIKESKSLIKEIEKMKENEATYKQALSLISQQFKIPQSVVKEAIRECENINEKENENER